MRRFVLALFLAVLACASRASAQYDRVFGFCEIGGQNVTVQGLTQSAPPAVQASFVGCTVNVYNAGLLTQPTIYSTATGGTLSNPFQASLTTGYWYFYATPGLHVDVTISSAGIATPFTYGDIIVGGGSGGSGNPGGSDTQLQENCSGAFCGLSNVTVDNSGSPTTITFGLDVKTCAHNPVYDVRCAGVRAVTSPPSTTANVTGTAATLTSGTGFQKGDGVWIAGAGAASPLSAPGSVTVTPSEPVAFPGSEYNVAAPSGSTNYTYEVEACEFLGGCSPYASASTSTGNALGQQSVSITSFTRSNNVVTFTTSAQTLSANTPICITGTSDYHLNFQCAAVMTTGLSSTQFELTLGYDTRADSGLPTSGTGGTATWFQGNTIAWTASTGGTPWLYLICNASGTVIGHSRPGENQWTDFGTTMEAGQVFQPWVPSTCGSSATKDYGSNTIASITGNNATLSSSVTTNVTGASFVFDNAPNIVTAAATAYTNQEILYFPAPQTVGQYITTQAGVDLTSYVLHVQQNGPIKAADTWKWGTVDWEGDSGNYSNVQFQYYSGVAFTCTGAFPCLYWYQPQGWNITGVTFYDTANAAVVIDQQNGYNSGIFKTNFELGSSSQDYLGMAWINYGGANMQAEFTTFLPSSPSSFGSTLTPMVYFRNDIPNANPAGSFISGPTHWSMRGFGVVRNPLVGGNADYEFSKGSYIQGGIEPFLQVAASNAGLYVKFDGFTNDTSDACLFADYATNGTGSGNKSLVMSRNTSTGGPRLCGYPAAEFNSTQDVAIQGQNVNIDTENSAEINGQGPLNNALFGSSYADKQFREQVHFPSGHPMFWDLAAPTGVSATVSSGGSVPVGAHTYNVVGVSFDGGEGLVSANATCTTTTGNQTCAITWTNPSPSYYSTIRVYRDTHGTTSGTSLSPTSTSFSDTSATTSSQYVTNNGGGGAAGGGLIDLSPNLGGVGGIMAPSVFMLGQVNSSISLYAGSDFCTQLQNALTVATVGEILDGRNIGSNQTCATNPFSATPVAAVTVILPAVKIASTGVTWNLAGWNGLTLQGEGSQAGGQPSAQAITELDFTNTGATDGIQIGNTNLTLKGFTVNMKSTGTGNCIDINAGMLYFEWDNVECLNSGGDGVFFDGGSGSNTTQNGVITRLISHGNAGAGIHVKATVSANGNSQIDFIRSIAYNNTGDGWKAESTVSGTRNSGIQVIGGRSENNGGSGADFVGDGFWRFFGFESEGNTGYGFTCDSNSDRIQVYGDSYSSNTAGNFHCIAGGATNITEVPDNINTNAAIDAALIQTQTNCSSSASPAVCAAASSGSIAIPAGTNPTLVVDTTAVTANSQIQITEDQSLGTKLSVTCNTATLPTNPIFVTARTAATSFTIEATGTFSTNPVCVSYTIIN